MLCGIGLVGLPARKPWFLGLESNSSLTKAGTELFHQGNCYDAWKTKENG